MYQSKRKKVRSVFVILLICLICLQSLCRAGLPAVLASTKEIPKSRKVSVLLIGNSMVKRRNNDTMKYLKNLAKGAGRKMTLDYVAYSNEKLMNWANPKHANGRKAYKKIADRKWDFIILQEHTDYAIAHRSTFVSASKKLAAYIYKKCPDTQIIYNCTWAYDKTKKLCGKRYSYSAQQKNMNANYKKAAAATRGRVCWTGNAFKAYRKQKGAKGLYLKDKNHATSYGWFLNAACMYAAIFGASPSESTYCGGLNKRQVKQMKKIAWQENRWAGYFIQNR